MKRRLLVVAGLLLGGVGVTGWTVDHRRAAEGHAGERRRDLALAEAQVGELRRQWDLVAKAAAAVESERQISQSRPSTSSHGAAGGPAETGENASMSQLIKQLHSESNKPAGQLRMLARRRAELSGTFAPLYRRLRLTPDQIASFESNRMAREEAHSDLNAAAQAQGLSLEDPAVIRLRGILYADHDKAQEELLGPARMEILREFERTSGPRGIVRELATAALLEGIPFTQDQTDRLVDLLAQASPGFRAGKSAGSLDTDWDQVDAGLATALSDAQLKLVRTTEPGGGLFFARWNAALSKAVKLERPDKK